MSPEPHDESAATALPERRRADDALPPVEPPTAGFLLQLFFIPMLIVGIIVLVWLSIGYLANMGQDIETIAGKLERSPTNDWPTILAADTLLKDPQQAALRHNAAYARRLSDGLKLRLDAAQQGDLKDVDSIKFRGTLARLIGERFAVADVIPILVRAATQEGLPQEVAVRHSALEGLAALANSLGPEELRARKEVSEAIEKALGERGEPVRDQLRERAAFLLGVLGGPAELDRLAQVMGDDPAPNVRYNGALGLARAGDARALPELLRMLDPTNAEVISGETHANDIAWKRMTVQLNAIAGAKQFIAKNPTADVTGLTAALVKLRASNPPGAVDAPAADLLHSLEALKATP